MCRTFVFDVLVSDHLPVLAIYNSSVGKELCKLSFRNFSLKSKEAFLNNITESIGKINIKNTQPGRSIDMLHGLDIIIIKIN